MDGEKTEARQHEVIFCNSKHMPSTSKAQQRLMGAALSAKRGGKTFPLARKVAGQMSESQLKDFTKLKKKKK